MLQIADACAWGKLHFGDPNSSYRMLEPLQRDNIKQALEPCVEFFSNLFEELCAPRISTNNAMEDPVQEYRLHMAAFLDAVAHLKVRACQATEELAHLWETIDILTDIIHEDSENDEP